MTTTTRPTKTPDPERPSALALRRARAAAGLSTNGAAPLLGLSRASLREAESGSWHVSDGRLAELIARYDEYALARGLEGM